MAAQGAPGGPAPAPPPPPPAAPAAAAGQQQAPVPGFYQLIHPTNPRAGGYFADIILDSLTTRQIVDVLKLHPTFAGYVVAQYGRRRWRSDGWLCLRNSQETEIWHRERNREEQLRTQLQLLIAQRLPLVGTPAALPSTQRILFVLIELENIKRGFLLWALRGIIANQQAYNPFAGLAQPTLLQQRYIDWRAQILQDLGRRIHDCDSALQGLIVRLVITGPNPARPNPPTWVQHALNPAWLPTFSATANLIRHPCLIDMLVQNDCVDALRCLRWLGVFTPVSYTRQGHTMLHEALSRNIQPAIRYLIQSYMPTQIWALPYGTLSLQHDDDEPSDLEFLVAHRRWVEFERIWRRIQPGFAALQPAWQPRGTDIFRAGYVRDILATWATRAFAEVLEAWPLSLDLAAIQPQQHNPRVAVQGGEIWHLAVLNDNTDFLDFVYRLPGNIILLSNPNITGPPILTALDLAIQENRRDHAARLIHPRPSMADAPARIEHGSPVGAGTVAGGWLHDIVNGLNDHMTRINNDPNMARAQKTKERSKYAGRAKALIQKIIAGTVYSMPVDRNMVDAAGLTARALAEQLGLSRTVINVL
ncbi:hypothetical protein BJX62DRAFT_232504 [Aspergillus germanicus]